ncbi:MAG: hypothetical protein ACJ77K_00610 [Bacteroidia bacterium]
MKWNKIKVHYLLRLALFWFVFFALFRVLFIIYHHARIPDGQHSETSMSFLYALRLDLATTCALMIIPFFLWALQQFNKNRMIHRVNLVYNYFVISLASILSIFNIKLYGEYGTLMNSEDLVYLLYPKEAQAFLSLWSFFLLLAASAFFAYLGIQSYRRNITSFSVPYENKKSRLAQLIVISIALFLGLRGGIRALPVNQEDSHYSGVQINNDIATNNLWYLGHSICHRKDEIIKNETH